MHPSVIAGAMPAPLIGEPLGGLPLAKSPLQGEVPPQAAEGCGTLATPLPSRVSSARTVPQSFRLRYAARRAKSPALQNKANGGRDEKHLSAARPVFLAPVPGLGTCSRQIVGRAFTPAARPSAAAAFPGRCLASSRKSCRSPQCLGAHSFFSAAFRLSPGCPAGEIARPTMQGKRQAKPETLPLRLTFLFPAPIAGDSRAGVHARRETFRPPPCIRAREAHGPSKLRTPTLR